MPICPNCGEYGPRVGDSCPDDDFYFVDEDALQASTNDALLGTLVADKYVVIDRLAEGGMGAIYRALQQPVQRDVALKVLHAEVNRSDTGRKRFIREARAISKLSHPNIITLHDFGFDDGQRPFMVMEYASGSSLKEWLRGSDLTTQRIIHVARQVLSALAEAHSHDIVHRDLKPANVMLTRAGHDRDFAKLLDFGLARLLSSDSAQGLTRDGEVFGTPHYMSPEQARARGDITVRSDVYSMGILLYRMFCGRVPFHADQPLQVLFQHINDPMPDPVAQRGLVLPDGLAGVIERATSKESDQRYADADAMLSAFEGAVEDADRAGQFGRPSRSPTPRGIDAVSGPDASTEADTDDSRDALATAPTLASIDAPDIDDVDVSGRTQQAWSNNDDRDNNDDLDDAPGASAPSDEPPRAARANREPTEDIDRDTRLSSSRWTSPVALVAIAVVAVVVGFIAVAGFLAWTDGDRHPSGDSADIKSPSASDEPSATADSNGEETAAEQARLRAATTHQTATTVTDGMTAAPSDGDVSEDAAANAGQQAESGSSANNESGGDDIGDADETSDEHDDIAEAPDSDDVDDTSDEYDSDGGDESDTDDTPQQIEIPDRPSRDRSDGADTESDAGVSDDDDGEEAPTEPMPFERPSSGE